MSLPVPSFQSCYPLSLAALQSDALVSDTEPHSQIWKIVEAAARLSYHSYHRVFTTVPDIG